MKNHIKGAAVAAMLVLSLSACRKESDTVHNYSYMDALAWSKAGESYGEQFKILWEGLNTNYAIWDYEKEQGLDWDRVYDQYYPKFTELDTLAKKRVVTDEELHALYLEVLSPLHDGHLFVDIKNRMTGNFLPRISPSDNRINKERKADFEEAYQFGLPNLSYYQGKLKEYKHADATGWTQKDSVVAALSAWAENIIKETSAKTLLTEEELSKERVAYNIQYELNKLKALDENGNIGASVSALNAIVSQYAYLNIPHVHTLDMNLIEKNLSMTYALFEGNVAYLQFNTFSITPFITEFPNAQNMDPYAAQLAAEVKNVWESWFQAIQDLHNAGQLGGVIIDVRGNNGGLLSDYAYVLGSLVPSGGLHMMNSRFKRGIGRYDYSPVMPQVMSTLEQPHVTVTERIAVLANAKSVSMAEMTSMGTRVLDNAKLIGTRTWGGICALTDNTSYSYNYSGHVGIEGQTPVYIYCPTMAAMDLDGKILEGTGVTPDIEVHMDNASWNNGWGPDTQLERALQYISSGK